MITAAYYFGWALGNAPFIILGALVICWLVSSWRNAGKQQ